MTLRLWRLFSVALAAAVAACCTSPRAGAVGAAPDPEPAISWPSRIEPASPVRAGLRHAVREIDAPMGMMGFRTGPVYRPSEDDRADAAALLGDRADSAVFEGAGAFVFRTINSTRLQPERKGGPKHFVCISGTGEAGGKIELERTWFAFHAPKGDSAKGLALLMPGLLGTPEPVLALFVKRLTADGWGVVQMMSQPSRFTERIVFDLDLNRPEEAVAPVAAEFDQRVAECALAVEAAFAHVASEHGELAALPRIAVGMSGGAMTLPTVVAREAEKYAACVMIAGGCNFFAMSDESNYKLLISAVDFRWLPSLPSDEQRRQMEALYLERATLDSYVTAAALHGKPVLMIHGTHDLAVPARLGDLLWERLGKPERWVREAGHEEVFMKMREDSERIMLWLNGTLKPALEPQNAG